VGRQKPCSEIPDTSIACLFFPFGCLLQEEMMEAPSIKRLSIVEKFHLIFLDFE
jgi:hypothetical protein